MTAKLMSAFDFVLDVTFTTFKKVFWTVTFVAVVAGLMLAALVLTGYAALS